SSGKAFAYDGPSRHAAGRVTRGAACAAGVIAMRTCDLRRDRPAIEADVHSLERDRTDVESGVDVQSADGDHGELGGPRAAVLCERAGVRGASPSLSNPSPSTSERSHALSADQNTGWGWRLITPRT